MSLAIATKKYRHMLDQTHPAPLPPETRAGREWAQLLAKYREPSSPRAAFELCVTVGPFLALWGLAWWALSLSYVLSVVLALCAAPFLLRLFAIQHDCGHGAFFKSRSMNDWLGRALGVVTLTPYDVWRHSHSIHHSSSGNLGRRGIGDINTLTVAEYAALTRFQRLKYRLYRNPLVLFGLGPGYIFLLENRLPLGFMGKARYWVSAMATNAVLVAVLGLVAWFGGLMPILLIFLPSTVLAATAGVWLFYVQHQFETTHWESDENWQLHDAALEGSSHYVLPGWLQWLSANIGIHHVHHVNSRIPFYRLPEALRDHAQLAQINRMTIRESLANARLHLWDEKARRLLSFAEARAVIESA
jgi:omega-6 fatty acid desaturase (delta-12 desaturase)